MLQARHLGDFNNALGIASVLADRADASVEVVDAALRSNAMLPLVRAAILLARSSRQGPARMLARIVLHDHKLGGDGDGAITGVVSTLGRGEAPGALLAALHGAASIHLGAPKRLPRLFFDAIVAHQGVEAGPGEISLAISPTRQRLSRGRKDALVVALGGDGDGVRYDLPFWRQFIERSLDLAAERNLVPYATTSPRTGEAAARELSARWQARGQAPERLLPFSPGSSAFSEMLGRADVLCVSAESVSMISDAIASGARVAAAFRDEVPSSERIAGFLRQQEKARRVALWDVAHAGGPDLDGLRVLDTCWSEDLWSQLPDCVREALRRSPGQPGDA